MIIHFESDLSIALRQLSQRATWRGLEEESMTSAQTVVNRNDLFLRTEGPSFATRASLGAIPKDTAVPEIGEGLATARALSGLAHDLFEATVSYIEENVHQRVTNATRYMKTGNRAGGRAVWAPDLQVV